LAQVLAGVKQCPQASARLAMGTLAKFNLNFVNQRDVINTIAGPWESANDERHELDPSTWLCWSTRRGSTTSERMEWSAELRCMLLHGCYFDPAALTHMEGTITWCAASGPEQGRPISVWVRPKSFKPAQRPGTGKGANPQEPSPCMVHPSAGKACGSQQTSAPHCAGKFVGAKLIPGEVIRYISGPWQAPRDLWYEVNEQTWECSRSKGFNGPSTTRYLGWDYTKKFVLWGPHFLDPRDLSRDPYNIGWYDKADNTKSFRKFIWVRPTGFDFNSHLLACGSTARWEAPEGKFSKGGAGMSGKGAFGREGNGMHNVIPNAKDSWDDSASGSSTDSSGSDTPPRTRSRAVGGHEARTGEVQLQQKNQKASSQDDPSSLGTDRAAGFGKEPGRLLARRPPLPSPPLQSPPCPPSTSSLAPSPSLPYHSHQPCPPSGASDDVVRWDAEKEEEEEGAQLCSDAVAAGTGASVAAATLSGAGASAGADAEPPNAAANVESSEKVEGAAEAAGGAGVLVARTKLWRRLSRGDRLGPSPAAAEAPAARGARGAEEVAQRHVAEPNHATRAISQQNRSQDAAAAAPAPSGGQVLNRWRSRSCIRAAA